MSTPARIAAFLVALVVVFAAAIGIGKAIGPVSDPARGSSAHGEEHDGSPTPDSIPGGLMISQDGYTLALSPATASPGPAVSVIFRILGPDGITVTDFDTEHEKPLHLIAVRRDFTGFQHVHPTLGSDGGWTTRLALSPGQWRVFADFSLPGQGSLILGDDLAVPGDFQPAPPRPQGRTTQVDGYTVSLQGDLTPGADSRLTLRVSRDGQPVTNLEPYLGAYGHLVALRSGDLAYLHVHPDGEPGDGTTEPGPEVTFDAAVPSPGTYHLYLDFQHEGVVRTAAFAIEAADATAKGGHTGDGHDN